ncbi:MAG: T9SS type A sorting domain-containing protein, partial [Rhodothermales bacterium]|nr:T9SS type A sorting domain-containing protein [Rhodothermales bacterium]
MTDVRRALIVFLRFRDDAEVLTGCTERARQWSEPDSMPAIAEYLIAPDREPPFDPRSITDYFYQQSNGRLILYGAVYPEVYVTAKRESEYGVGRLDLEAVTREVLETINRDNRFDLSDYDENGDGYLDYVVFVVRDSGRLRRSGSAFIGYTSPAPEYGRDMNNLKSVKAEMSGAYIRYDNPGNIYPGLNMIRLIAHEFSHSFFQMGHHKTIGGSLRAPQNDPGALAYLLMAGVEGRGGSLTLGASERHLLGREWIQCSTLAADTTVRVADLYSSQDSNCFRIDGVDGRGQDATLYVSNRQRIGHFEKLRSESCTGSRSDHGLMSTGLLVTMADSTGALGVVPADNSLQLSTRSDAYAGDMFERNGAQLTPWTSPNIYGATSYQSDYRIAEKDFHAIDNIRADPTDVTAMLLDYKADVRHAPVFRQDATIGRESDGVTLHGPALVTGMTRLEIESRVTIEGSMIADGLTRLDIHANAVLSLDTLRLHEGATLSVEGVVNIGGYFEYRGATIELGAGGQINYNSNSHVQSQPECRKDRCELSLEVFPNPVLTHLTVQVAAHLPAKLSVVDIAGRVVAYLESHRRGDRFSARRWNTSRVAAGTYFIRATTHG